MTDEAHAEFDGLIAQLAAADDEAAQGEIRKAIWDRFGATGTTFISDMANFSSTSRTLGICHFLKLIHRTRETVSPIIRDNNGILLKYDADNCYAFFDDPGDAVQASLDINSALFDDNQKRDIDEHIYVSVGIDHGELLLVGDSEYFGDPVNTASKLGEDLAIRGETLVTDRALRRTSVTLNENVERMVARISDIEIAYVRIPMTQAVRRAAG
jgi:class 3 adenylate cyclase